MSAVPGHTMKASVLCDVHRLEVRDIPRPAISPYEVLIRVAAVGLCGTDVHIFAGHANYNTNERGLPIPLALQPQILGHEISGTIEEVGQAVTDLKAGDRVVVDQGLNCVSTGRSPLCEYCQSGDSHQCEFYEEHGITGMQGGLAEFISVPAVNAIRVSAAIDPAEAALVEPLGCIIHSSDAVAAARSRYAIDADLPERRVRTVLICGAGPAGLLFTQYLRRVLRRPERHVVADIGELLLIGDEALQSKARGPHISRTPREWSCGGLRYAMNGLVMRLRAGFGLRRRGSALRRCALPGPAAGAAARSAAEAAPESAAQDPGALAGFDHRDVFRDHRFALAFLSCEDLFLTLEDVAQPLHA